MATPSSRMLFGILPWYGVLIVFGAGLAVFLADREANRQKMPPDTMIDLALRALPIGIVGARIYYVIFSWSSYASDPLSMLYIWNGGLAIYGGLLAGLVTVFFFCRRRKLSLMRVLDILIPGVALAQAIGRWGNYFNQEAFGLALESGSPLAFFPVAVLIQEGADTGWHLATFFYESLWDFLIFLFLCHGRRKRFHREGDEFLFYCFLYAAGRMVIENLRLDALLAGGGVRVSQLLSVLICAGIMEFFRIRYPGASPLDRILRVLSWIVHLGAVWFCIRGASLLSIPASTLCLAIYSLWNIVLTLGRYGRGGSSEVIYANHEA